MANTIITISRGYGSGGRTIGRLLSKMLGVPCFDRELIYMISSKKGIDKSILSESDESIRRQFGNISIPSENKRYVSSDEIYLAQSGIIREAADRGNCVIIGRCADFVLKNSGHRLVRAFIWAPEETCCKNLSEKLKISEQEATKMIKQIDRHRSDYYRHHTDNEWSSAKNYDICIDTSRFSFEDSAELIAQYAKFLEKL